MLDSLIQCSQCSLSEKGMSVVDVDVDGWRKRKKRWR